MGSLSLTEAAAILDEYPGLGPVMGLCLVGSERTEDPLTPELRHCPVPAPEWLPGRIPERETT